MRAKFQTFALSILRAARLTATLPNMGRYVGRRRFEPRNADKECKVPGCTKPAKARRFCNAHYSRWWRTGNPLPPPPGPRPTVDEIVAECWAAYYSALTTTAVLPDLDSSRTQP